MEKKIEFNKAYANKVSEAQFIEDHKHHSDDVDLSEVWKSLQDPSQKAAATKAASKQSKDTEVK